MFMTGIGSGIDFNSMIDVIVAAERKPKDNQLNRQEGMNTAEMDALKEIQSTINSFRGTVEDLNSVTKLNKLKSELSNSDVLGATIGAGAVAGEYNFNVTQLAQAGRDRLLTVDKGSFLSAGKISFTTDKGEVSVDMAALSTELVGKEETNKTEYQKKTLKEVAEKHGIDLSTDAGITEAAEKLKTEDSKAYEDYAAQVKSNTDEIDRLKTKGVSLEEVQSAINNHKNNDGEKVTMVQSGAKVTMVLNAKNTGSDNAVKGLKIDPLSGIHADGSAATISDQNVSLQTAKNATIVMGETDDQGKPINGAMTITSATNKMENVIDGLTLTLKKPGDVNIKVERDEAGVKDTVKKFVNSYNKVMETVNTYTKSSEDGAAALSGDAGVRSMVSRLRSVISDEYSASTLETLSQLGVTTKVDGTLEINQSKMDKALEDNFDEIANLFMGNPLDDKQPGLMTNMMTVLDDYHKNGGLFDIRQDRLEQDNKRLGEEREALDTRMEAKTVSLRAYYAKMDSQIAQMNQTQNTMLSMLM